MRHLEHFVTVAEQLNFTRASRRLHIAQSGLSVSIRAIERNLSARLFIRSSQAVVLTGAGAVLVEHARTVLAEVAAARRVGRVLLVRRGPG